MFEEVWHWAEEAQEEETPEGGEAVRTAPVHREVFPADRVPAVRPAEAEEARTAVPAVPAGPVHRHQGGRPVPTAQARRDGLPAAPVSRALTAPLRRLRPGLRRLPDRQGRRDHRGRSSLARPGSRSHFIPHRPRCIHRHPAAETVPAIPPAAAGAVSPAVPSAWWDLRLSLQC